MEKKKKKTSVERTLEEAIGGPVGPYQRLAIDACVPNPWNPNKMSEAVRDKLVRGIKMLHASAANIPPIIVRPHPDDAEKYQIIDGYHRWDILRAEGHAEIDAYVLAVDTPTAMILTDTLNYLRGAPDPDLHAQYYQQLLEVGRFTYEQVSDYLPVTSEEIKQTLEAYSITIDHLEVPDETDGSSEDQTADPFVEVKFLMSRSQQEVVERELARIGAFLQGKNIRGRALEFMAVNSSNTLLDNLMGRPTHAVIEEEEEDEKPVVKVKVKLPVKKAAPLEEDDDEDDDDEEFPDD